MQADSTLTGVIIGAAVAIIGSILTFLGTLFNNWLSGKREDRQWTREHASTEAKRLREEEQTKHDKTHNIFQNALSCLSALMTINSQEISLPEKEKLERLETAHEWVNLIALRYRKKDSPINSDFHRVFDKFINNPLDMAEEMRDAVLELASDEKFLFPEVHSNALTVPDANTIVFHMRLDNDFRKEQIKDAIELPLSDTFECKLSDLTESQRELLANIYFPLENRIPKTIYLSLPSPKPNPKYPYTVQARWNGRVDPSTADPVDILRLWEADYKEEFERVYSKPADSEIAE